MLVDKGVLMFYPSSRDPSQKPWNHACAMSPKQCRLICANYPIVEYLGVRLVSPPDKFTVHTPDACCAAAH